MQWPAFQHLNLDTRESPAGSGVLGWVTGTTAQVHSRGGAHIHSHLAPSRDWGGVAEQQGSNSRHSAGLQPASRQDSRAVMLAHH